MKKVTLSFVVSDDVANDVQNDLGWGEMGNAAAYLNAHCEESDYEVEECENKANALAELYFCLTASEKDEFLELTGNN